MIPNHQTSVLPTADQQKLDMQRRRERLSSDTTEESDARLQIRGDQRAAQQSEEEREARLQGRRDQRAVESVEETEARLQRRRDQ